MLTQTLCLVHWVVFLYSFRGHDIYTNYNTLNVASIYTMRTSYRKWTIFYRHYGHETHTDPI